MPKKPYGTPIFIQKGTPEPIMKDGREVGTRWRDEKGQVIYAEWDSDAFPMQLSAETKRRLKEIDQSVRICPSPLRRRFARW